MENPLEPYRLEDKSTYLFKPEQCLDKMLTDLKKKERGSTTHSKELDKCWI